MTNYGNSYIRKTWLMRKVEEKYQRPLEQLLSEIYNDRGLPAMSEEMGISKGTLWYWLLKFGINVRRVALRPGEELEIKYPVGYVSTDRKTGIVSMGSYGSHGEFFFPVAELRKLGNELVA